MRRHHARATVRCAAGLLVAVGFVVGWSATANADDDPDEEVTAEVELMPDDPDWAECPHSTCSGPAYDDPW